MSGRLAAAGSGVVMTSNTDEVVAHAAAVGEDLASLAAFQELILERSHDLITILDPLGTIVYGSPAWQAFGWDPEGLVGTPILDLVHPDDVATAAAALETVVGGGPVEALTARIHTRAGAWVWHETSG